MIVGKDFKARNCCVAKRSLSVEIEWRSWKAFIWSKRKPENSEKTQRKETLYGKTFLVKLGFSFAGACAIILLLEVCPQDFLRFYGGTERER